MMFIIIIFRYFYFPSTNIVHNPPSSYTANPRITLANFLPTVLPPRGAAAQRGPWLPHS